MSVIDEIFGGSDSGGGSGNSGFVPPALFSGALETIMKIFGSLNPGCWGAQAYPKTKIETQINFIKGFYSQIVADPNNLNAASSLLYSCNYQEALINYDLGRLVNTCSKENAKKCLEIWLSMRASLLPLYEYYQVQKTESGLTFMTQIPTGVKVDAPTLPTEPPIFTGGGTTTGGGSTSNGGSSSNTGTDTNAGATYRTVTLPGCGSVRVYNNGTATDLNGNIIDIRDCAKGGTPIGGNGSASLTDWGGVIDWGDGSISLNSGKTDYTPFLIGGGLLAAFFMFNKKK